MKGLYLAILLGTAASAFAQQNLANEVKQEFLFSWHAYEQTAWGHDELKPISKSTKDWYGDSLLMTPVDALDTMLIMSLSDEATKARTLIDEKLSFDKDVNAKVFEVTIRLLGGLLSGYEMTGDPKLLALAEDLGKRLMPAFESPTGLPYMYVNLRSGKTSGVKSNPAEIGTLILEFGTLSKLTHKPVYFDKAKRALVVLYGKRSKIGLVGDEINVETGEWVSTTSHVGGGIDSYYEYLLKCAELFHDKQCRAMYDTSITSVNKYLQDGAWYGEADMNTGKRTATEFGALHAFLPAVLALGGDVKRAKTLEDSCFRMWTQFGIEPEVIDYKTMEAKYPGYQLRPEIIESAYYLYLDTHDPKYQQMGRTFFDAIKSECRTDTGYTTLRSVVTKEKGDLMPSYFLAETLKYLYLLADPKALDFKNVVFNTEAHPLQRQPMASGRHYTMMLGANRAGTQVTRVENGVTTIDFEFNDRGRGPKTTTTIRFGDNGLPVEEKTSGIDYYKTPISETFVRTGGVARWQNNAEKGEQKSANAFFPSMYGPPEEIAFLAKALLAAPNHKLSLLPTGEASIGKVTELVVDGKRIIDYAISGLSFTPSDIWLESDGTFFASVSAWSTLVRDGHEKAIEPMLKAQDAAASKRAAQLTKRLQHKPPSGTIAIENVNLFDSVNARVLPARTIVIRGDRIESIDPDKIPADATVIDGKGKTVIPGLWDMHVHLSPDDGLLDIAAGVTTVRDMANDIDFLMDTRKKYDAGTEVGPRIIAAGFMDGPGPYAGPTKVLVSTEDEVKAAIDRYKSLGYEQIKIYSSMKPALVPFITRYAHENGLRVSGHIPAFMYADQAVQQGYDEIQHMNMLFLNFMRDVQDTRTPARFTTVAERGADLDLQSQDVRDFVALLKSKNIVSDPTLSAFEPMFTARQGTMSPVVAEVADRFPTQVRRGFLTGGLPVPEGKDARYRASFRHMLDFTKLLYDSGVRIVAGTDGMAGYQLARELELYVDAGIPAPAVLQIATLGAARVMKHDKDLGSIEPGKYADLVIIDGNPAENIHDVRKPVTVISRGTIYDVAEVERAIGITPLKR